MVWFGGAVKVDERIEITDEESVRVWVQQQDQRTQIWFGTRCALRALPALNTNGQWNMRMTALPCLRSVLTSSAKATCTASTLPNFYHGAHGAIDGADLRARDVDSSPAHPVALHPNRLALVWAIRATKAIGAEALFDDAKSYSSLGKSSEAAFSAAMADIKRPLEWPRLWGNIDQPLERSEAWENLKADLTERDQKGEWSFWIEWYEAILAGNPLPWELTRRIALQVTDDEREDGPAAVARAVAPIYLPHKLERQIAELQAELTVARSRDRGIGDNNPPEPIKEAALENLPPIIWSDLEALKAESASLCPNLSRLLWFQQRFTDGAARIGQLAKDVAYDETKQIVSSAIGASIALNWIKIQKLILNISETIAQWIAHLV